VAAFRGQPADLRGRCQGRQFGEHQMHPCIQLRVGPDHGYGIIEGGGVSHKRGTAQDAGNAALLDGLVDPPRISQVIGIDDQDAVAGDVTPFHDRHFHNRFTSSLCPPLSARRRY